MTQSIFLQIRWECRTQWSQRSRPVVLKWLIRLVYIITSFSLILLVHIITDLSLVIPVHIIIVFSLIILVHIIHGLSIYKLEKVVSLTSYFGFVTKTPMPITSKLHLQSLQHVGVFCCAVCSIGRFVVCVNLSFNSQVICDITIIFSNCPCWHTRQSAACNQAYFALI